MFVLYDLSSSLCIGVYTDLTFLRDHATDYAIKNELELNIDLVCYAVTTNVIKPIGIDDKNLIPI